MSNNQKVFFFLYKTEDVLKWLEEINLEKYKETFRSNKIDGNDLYYLNNEDIKSDLKINNMHDRNKLILELNKLKSFKICFTLNYKEENLKLNLDFEPSITLDKIFPLICNVLQIQKVINKIKKK
jgi:hypothetical protein